MTVRIEHSPARPGQPDIEPLQAYMGLDEAAALTRALAFGIKARIVECDGNRVTLAPVADAILDAASVDLSLRDGRVIEARYAWAERLDIEPRQRGPRP